MTNGMTPTAATSAGPPCNCSRPNPRRGPSPDPLGQSPPPHGRCGSPPHASFHTGRYLANLLLVPEGQFLHSASQNECSNTRQGQHSEHSKQQWKVDRDQYYSGSDYDDD